MASCRGCGKEIIWIKMTSGKSMPCNQNPVAYWEKPKASGKIITPNGMTISCEFEGDPKTATGIGYVPHWATCSQNTRFLRKSD
jgi:hypothetical protein